MDLAPLAELSADLAVSAGGLVRRGQEQGLGAVESKSSAVDIVTEIDKASEAHIVNALRRLRPDDGILGEEGTSIAGTSRVRWVVDPLDGTVNCTYGLTAYAVCIGAEVDGMPAVGAVYCPATDELFTAWSGGGARRNAVSITARHEDQMAQALVATGFSYAAEKRAEQGAVVARLLPQVRDIRRSGSAAIDLCNVAVGRIDAYFEHGVHPWDITAASVIAREAGAVVTGYTQPEPAHDVVAANPALHPKLHAFLRAN